MKILFSATEFAPLIKTGGMGDVVYSLSRELAKHKKHQVSVVIPAYDIVVEKTKQSAKPYKIIESPITKEKIKIEIVDQYSPVRLFIVHSEHYRNKEHPYTDNNKEDYTDNFLAFSIFSYVSAYLCYDHASLKKNVDVVVCNDWQSGLVPAYIDAFNNAKRDKVRSFYVIHNISFPGIFPKKDFDTLALNDNYFNQEGMEYHNKISFQKSGIFFADKAITVSPNYCHELATYENVAMGFQGILNKKKDDFSGILNGIDVENWSPEFKENVRFSYSSTKLLGKKKCKNYFLKQHFSKTKNTLPFFGMVSRLTYQKGIDVLIEYLQVALKDKKFNMAILGTGDSEYENQLAALSSEYNNFIFFKLFDESLSKEIISSTDVLIIPSRFEPCGLTQMYAQSMGTLPLVHPVGGLRDSVIDVALNNKVDKAVNGFYIQELSTDGMDSVVQQIIKLYKDQPSWKKCVFNAMKVDNSWAKSKNQYIKLFKSTI